MCNNYNYFYSSSRKEAMIILLVKRSFSSIRRGGIFFIQHQRGSVIDTKISEHMKETVVRIISRVAKS